MLGKRMERNRVRIRRGRRPDPEGRPGRRPRRNEVDPRRRASMGTRGNADRGTTERRAASTLNSQAGPHDVPGISGQSKSPDDTTNAIRFMPAPGVLTADPRCHPSRRTDPSRLLAI